MTNRFLPALFIASCALAPAPALAEQEDVAQLRAEIARLRGALESMEARLNKVEAAPAPAAGAAPAPMAAAAKPAPASAEPQTTIDWKGAPQFKRSDGLAFKPRGRLQLDTNNISRPEGNSAPTLGWSADVRRAYLGVDGALGGGFGYRLEVDFASGNAQFTDAWMTYENGPLTLTLGHHRITTLEDMTSDLDTSFLERAAYTQAFGIERRLGFSAEYSKGAFQISTGIFSDDLETLGSGITSNAFSLDTRIVAMPKLGETQLHFGGSVHYRELNDVATAVRYRARPAARTTDMRFVDTGAFSATGETGYGLEFALVRGPIHVATEAFWQKVARPGLADPTFFGGYGEIGYVIAGAKGRPYRDGAFGTMKPTRGIDKGGSGAWQINARYDWLDLNDTGVIGGKQRTYGASLVWVPIEHIKFLANYQRVEVSDTPVLAGSQNAYGVDVFGLRAQYDF